MHVSLFENETFQKQDYSNISLEKGEYENCRFIDCNFVASDLSHTKFLDCEFIHCNLSMTKLMGTSLQDVRFQDSKLHGIQWNHCSRFLFEVTFEDCLLNFGSFSQIQMKKTIFRNCNLEEVDFTGCDLSGSTFDQCNLTKSLFQNTNLANTDFTTAYGYALDPEQNQVKKAKFSLDGLPGLLMKYDINIR